MNSTFEPKQPEDPNPEKLSPRELNKATLGEHIEETLTRASRTTSESQSARYEEEDRHPHYGTNNVSAAR